MVETLVAVTILMIGVIGPLVVAARGISDGLFAQNQITANFLAEEAIEMMVNRRDSNVLQGLPPLTGLQGTNPSVLVNAATGQITLNGCGANGCYLTYNPTARAYDVSASGPGTFRRQVSTEPVLNASAEIGEKITVTVWWKNKTVERSLTLIGYVFNE